jgi:glycosyltransferase involved in cell wall biosynthesis
MQKLRIMWTTAWVQSVARLECQKDFLTYIRAEKIVLLNRSKNTFLLVSEGSERKVLKNKIRELNIEENVILIGYHPEIAVIYFVIDIFVTASLWERSPRCYVKGDGF